MRVNYSIIKIQILITELRMFMQFYILRKKVQEEIGSNFVSSINLLALAVGSRTITSDQTESHLYHWIKIITKK